MTSICTLSFANCGTECKATKLAAIAETFLGIHKNCVTTKLFASSWKDSQNVFVPTPDASYIGSYLSHLVGSQDIYEFPLLIVHWESIIRSNGVGSARLKSKKKNLRLISFDSDPGGAVLKQWFPFPMLRLDRKERVLLQHLQLKAKCWSVTVMFLKHCFSALEFQVKNSNKDAI